MFSMELIQAFYKKGLLAAITIKSGKVVQEISWKGKWDLNYWNHFFPQVWRKKKKKGTFCHMSSFCFHLWWILSNPRCVFRTSEIGLNFGHKTELSGPVDRPVKKALESLKLYLLRLIITKESGTHDCAVFPSSTLLYFNESGRYLPEQLQNIIWFLRV